MMAHAVQDPPSSPGPESPSRTGTYRYYEGFIEKKGPKDKVFERRWAILEGDILLFYAQKVGNRELNTQKPLDTLSFDRTTSAIPEAKDRCRMNIKCKQGTYKMKATSAEDLESLWLKVVAVSTGIIPTERDLLPGQKQMFADIAAKEKGRKAMGISGGINTSTSASYRRPQSQKVSSTEAPVQSPRPLSQPVDDNMYKFYPDHLKSQLPTPPPWFFHKISRDHAEQILLKNPNHGHLLIRVSESHPGEYSLSVRQDMGGIVVKHYRFRWDHGTFKLLIDEQQPELASMYELIMFFIERSGGNLKPIQTRDPKVLKLPDNLYEHRFHQYTNTRPNRTSLPASFNQGYNPGVSQLAQQPLTEGVAQHDFVASSPPSGSGIKKSFSSQSLRAQGSNGYSGNSDNSSTPDNSSGGYMMMSSQKKPLHKDPYVNLPRDIALRPLPAVPVNRKRSISTSALPTGFNPEGAVTSQFNSQSSNQPSAVSNVQKLRMHSQSMSDINPPHAAFPPPLPSRTTNDNGGGTSQTFRTRTTSAPVPRGVPMHGLANEAELRSAFDRMGLDRH